MDFPSISSCWTLLVFCESQHSGFCEQAAEQRRVASLGTNTIDVQDIRRRVIILHPDI